MEIQCKFDVVIESATTRLRPVLKTTAATILNHFPLILMTGAGAEARNSIGNILVAGMAIGTFFTLFVLSVFYLWLVENRQTCVTEALNTTSALAKMPSYLLVMTKRG